MKFHEFSLSMLCVDSNARLVMAPASTLESNPKPMAAFGQERSLADALRYVSLIADGQAQDLYAQFGFIPTAPRSVGMAYSGLQGKPTAQRR